jgi:hypothetical protein
LEALLSTGRRNKLTGQVAEHLVCAELGRRDLIATPFSGNVPTFDVIAADEFCRVVPIQVKASRSVSWRTDARDWMDLELEPKTGIQRYRGPRRLADADLIYVCVVLHAPKEGVRDRFFVLTKADVQTACIQSYSDWMNPHAWRRPKNQASFDCRYSVSQIERFENNWDLIRTRLAVGDRRVAS